MLKRDRDIATKENLISIKEGEQWTVNNAGIQSINTLSYSLVSKHSKLLFIYRPLANL